MSPRDQAAVMALFLDAPEFARRAVTIRNKLGLDVPLVLSPAQLKLNAAIEAQAKKGLPIRIRVLKAGQVHMSVGCCYQIWKRVAFLPGQQAKVYAHLHEATKNLYNYIDQFDTSYQPIAGLRKLSRTKGSRINQSIAYEGGGRIEFGSAETSSGGRSTSFKYLHLSETAFWQRAEQLRTGLLNRVPELADTLIIDESTANGLGGPFYKGWMDANDPSSGSLWTPVFFGAHEHPEYQIAPADPVAFQRDLRQDELELQNQLNLTLAQLNWRRITLNGRCEGDIRRFNQEFPYFPEQAFLASGRPVFDFIALGRQDPKEPAVTGELLEERVGVKKMIVLEPSSEGRGLLRIWKKPEPGQRYVIGTDTCKGLDANSGTASIDPDFAVAQVLNAQSGEQVAVMRGRIEPGIFGEYLWALMRYYNLAYVVPDADSYGVATIGELLRLQVPTELIYQRQRPASDQQTARLQYIGFITTAVSKPQVISLLQRALRERVITLHDPITVAECRTFIYQPNGSMSAEEGAHDDTVMALALAVLALQQSYLIRMEREAVTNTSHKIRSYR